MHVRHQFHTVPPGNTRERGFTLLLAVLITGIVLAIGLAILSVTLKEFLLSSLARESAVSLSAADAGMECARYWDASSNGDRFDVGAGQSSISCMGHNRNINPGGAGGVATTDVQFGWGSPTVCARVTVLKYYSESEPLNMGEGRTCPRGTECTTIISRGYNRACGQLDNPRTVERALRIWY